MKFKNLLVKKNIYLLVVFLWLILWVVFLIKQNKRGEYIQLKFLYTHNDAERKRFIMGQDLYDFVDYCKEQIPAGKTYKFVGIEGLDMVRARYMLWPAIMDPFDPEFVLLYKSNEVVPGGYGVLKKVNDAEVIFKKKGSQG